MARLSASPSFIAKQAHMFTYDKDVFNEWLRLIENLEKQNKKPAATIFRYLCGLEEEEVKKIQAEIKAGTIVLSKGSKDGAELVDMVEHIKRLKQDRMIQDALIVEFHKFDGEVGQSWMELVAKYNINTSVYNKFIEMCDAWLRAMLTRGTKRIDFPEVARDYIEWTVKLVKEQAKVGDLPWSIYIVNLQMEGSSYLQRHYNNPIPIGLCVLDITETSKSSIPKEKEIFKDLIKGILAIAGGSIPSQYTLLTFLRGKDYAQLQLALQDCSKIVHKIVVAALHFAEDPCFVGAIEFFTVLVFFSKEEEFDGVQNSLAPGSQATTLDPQALNIDWSVARSMSNMDFLNLKKKLVLQQCIQKYCMEDRKLFDLFSGGLISHTGLEERRDMICLVENIDKQKELASSLLQFAESNEDIRKWAGLQCEQPAEQVVENVMAPPPKLRRPRASATEFLAREASMH